MVFNTKLIPYGGDKSFSASKGASFSGSDFMLMTGSSISSVDKGVTSFWMKNSSISGSTEFIISCGDDSHQEMEINSGFNTFYVYIRKRGTTEVFELRIQSSSMVGTWEDGAWHHFLISWDKSGQNSLVYIDDANISHTQHVYSYHINIPTSQNIKVGRQLTGDISEVYLKTGSYVDLTVTSNRRKFITSSEEPVYLGADGSIPFVAQPEVYLKGRGSGFNLNSGSGNHFSITGTLGTPSTSP